MSLRIDQTTRGGIAVLAVLGDITLGGASAELRDAFKKVLSTSPRGILIDLGAVAYIDSGGLGELVRCYSSADTANVPLRFCCLQPKVNALFGITKLSDVFEVFQGRDGALASYTDSSD